MKQFDAARANLVIGFVLLGLAAVNALRGEGNTTPLIVLGLCNVAIGAAARRQANG